MKPAVRHTIQLTIYVFVFTAALNLVLGLVGMDALTTFLGKDTWFQPFLTALLGPVSYTHLMCIRDSSVTLPSLFPLNLIRLLTRW